MPKKQSRSPDHQQNPTQTTNPTTKETKTMAIILEANYAKKLGLPNYSSHQYSVTIRTELTDPSQIAEESARLYSLLQDAVDKEIQVVGFMPDASRYGMNNGHSNGHSNGNGNHSNGNHSNGNGNGNHSNGSGNSNGHPPARRAPIPASDGWNCTEGQKGFLLRIINEANLDKAEVEALARQLFGVGVKELDKLQASQLIEDLLEKSGKTPSPRRSPWQGRQPSRA